MQTSLYMYTGVPFWWQIRKNKKKLYWFCRYLNFASNYKPPTNIKKDEGVGIFAEKAEKPSSNQFTRIESISVFDMTK